MLCMTSICIGQQPPKLPQPPQFIQMTQEVTFGDGAFCPLGIVEAVVDYTPADFVIWGNGKRYQVKRSQAKKITPEEAAVALYAERQALLNRQEKMEEALGAAMNNHNQLRNAQDQLTVLKQLQDLVNGGGIGNLPLPAAPLGQGTNSNHWIKTIIERGQTIQLEDGSLWQINPLSKVDAGLWLPTERITIVESGNKFYPHKLINSDGKTAAEAKRIR